MIFNVGGGSSGSEVKGYWWNKGTAEGEYNSRVIENYVNITPAVSSSSVATTIYYADSFTVDYATGKFILTNSSTISVSYDTYTNANTLKGKYFTTNGSPTSDELYFGTSYCSISRDGTGNRVTMVYATVMYGAHYNPTFIDYVHDMDINAYPNGGYAEDGYYYYGRFTLLDDPMNIDAYELVAEHTGSSLTSYTVPDLSQYKYFYMIVTVGNTASTPQFFPASLFRVADRMMKCSFSTNTYFQCTYVSDTEIKLYAGNNTGNIVKLYGMK